jgi:hypothetical protein
VLPIRLPDGMQTLCSHPRIHQTNRSSVAVYGTFTQIGASTSHCISSIIYLHSVIASQITIGVASVYKARVKYERNRAKIWNQEIFMWYVRVYYIGIHSGGLRTNREKCIADSLFFCPDSKTAPPKYKLMLVALYQLFKLNPNVLTTV